MYITEHLNEVLNFLEVDRSVPLLSIGFMVYGFDAHVTTRGHLRVKVRTVGILQSKRIENLEDLHEFKKEHSPNAGEMVPRGPRYDAEQMDFFVGVDKSPTRSDSE